MRTVLAVGLALAAAGQESLTLILVATGIYWVGDMADGVVARMMRRETRTGAVLDIICDRMCASVIYIGLVWLLPNMWIPIAIYLLSFSVLDLMLSLSFLLFPLSSPNYFYLADPLIYKLNWSRVAKGINSALFLVVVIAFESVLIATLLAIALTALKLYSLYLLSKVEVPTSGDCAHEYARASRSSTSP